MRPFEQGFSRSMCAVSGVPKLSVIAATSLQLKLLSEVRQSALFSSNTVPRRVPPPALCQVSLISQQSPLVMESTEASAVRMPAFDRHSLPMQQPRLMWSRSQRGRLNHGTKCSALPRTDNITEDTSQQDPQGRSSEDLQGRSEYPMEHNVVITGCLNHDQNPVSSKVGDRQPMTECQQTSESASLCFKPETITPPVTNTCHDIRDDRPSHSSSITSDSSLQCALCFERPPDLMISGCDHRLCGFCAEQLCKRLSSKPLNCP